MDDVATPVERICRHCDHNEVRHLPADGNMFHCGYVATFFTETNLLEFCPCYKFVPTDNLEYVELKLKEKEDEVLHL